MRLISPILLLDPTIFPVDLGWRLGFGIGAVLGLCILLLRKHVPEGLRWLITHAHPDEAEEVVRRIEPWVEEDTGKLLPAVKVGLTIHPRKSFSFRTVVRAVFKRYPNRSILALSLMISQAFLYNAIFFTYVLVLTRFYDVNPDVTGLYLLPFALGNFTGPLVLGRFFDTVGRRQTISGTYTASAVLLLTTGWLFVHGELTAFGQTALWTIIFFFASAAASSAYLTASEVFPPETRALAISFFYCVGTATGGIAAPWLFGSLIGSGSRMNVFCGYLAGAILMLAAGGVEALVGVRAERTSLEEIAQPLSANEAGE